MFGLRKDVSPLLVVSPRLTGVPGAPAWYAGGR